MTTYSNQYVEGILAIADRMKAEKKEKYNQRMQRLSQIEKKVGEYATKGYEITKAIGNYAIRGLKSVGRGAKEVATTGKNLADTVADIYIQSENYRQIENEFYRRLSEVAKENTGITARKSPSQKQATNLTKARNKMKKAKEDYEISQRTKKQQANNQSSTYDVERAKEAYEAAKKEYNSLNKPNNFKNRLFSRVIDAKKMNRLEAITQDAKEAGMADADTNKIYAMLNGNPTEIKALYPGKKKDTSKIHVVFDQYGNMGLKLDNEAGPEDFKTYFEKQIAIENLRRASEINNQRLYAEQQIRELSILANIYNSARKEGNVTEAKEIFEIIKEHYTPAKNKSK